MARNVNQNRGNQNRGNQNRGNQNRGNQNQNKDTQTSYQPMTVQTTEDGVAVALLSVNRGKYNTYVNFEMCGVTFYGSRVCYTKDGTPFIAPPSYKGTDGNYYKHYYLSENIGNTLLDMLESEGYLDE